MKSHQLLRLKQVEENGSETLPCLPVYENGTFPDSIKIGPASVASARI